MSDRSPQSAWSAIVDIATIAAMLAMALGKVTEPAAWTLLGGIISGRFGVSLGKTIERASSSGRGDGGGGGSGGGGGNVSDPKIRAARSEMVAVPVTEERPPWSIPKLAIQSMRAAIRSVHATSGLAFGALLVVTLVAAVAFAR